MLTLEEITDIVADVHAKGIEWLKDYGTTEERVMAMTLEYGIPEEVLIPMIDVILDYQTQNQIPTEVIWAMSPYVVRSVTMGLFIGSRIGQKMAEITKVSAEDV